MMFRDLGPKDHQYEMARWESNGHVTDDVTWSWKVMVVAPICLVSIISQMTAPPPQTPFTTSELWFGQQQEGILP